MTAANAENKYERARPARRIGILCAKMSRLNNLEKASYKEIALDAFSGETVCPSHRRCSYRRRASVYKGQEE